MKPYKKFIRASIAAVIATSAIISVAPAASIAETKSFKDVKTTDHYYESVLDLTSRGVITGYPDGTFKPGNSISRENAAKIIALALELDLKNVIDPGFSDVKKDHPYYAHIAALVSEGIIKGRPDHTFDPKGNLTRAQVSQILVLGFNMKVENYSSLPFKDINKGQAFSSYVQTMYNNKITTGTTATTFSPYAQVTRGQFATFLYRSEQLDNSEEDTLEVIDIS